MTGLDTFRGAVLLQRGAADLIAAAGGTTGTAPDADCTLSTRFQIASVSKQFTAAAIMLLADRGRLSVDDGVHRWLDGCPASWRSMTIGLVSHTAGLVHWLDLPGLDLTRPIAADEELRFFADAPLHSAPGQRFSYSSPGYVLLAWIVERAADQGYASFLAREIFEPLEMTGSFAGNGDREPGLAAGHRAGHRAASSFELDTARDGRGRCLVHGGRSGPVGSGAGVRPDPGRGLPAGNAHRARADRRAGRADPHRGLRLRLVYRA